MLTSVGFCIAMVMMFAAAVYYRFRMVDACDEIADLVTDLNAMREHRDAESRRADAAEQQLTACRQELRAAQPVLRELTTERDVLAESLAAVQQERNDVREIVVQVQKELDAERVALGRTRIALESHIAERAKWDRQEASYLATLQARKTDLDVVMAARDAATRERDVLKERRRKVTSTADSLHDHLEPLRAIDKLIRDLRYQLIDTDNRLSPTAESEKAN